MTTWERVTWREDTGQRKRHTIMLRDPAVREFGKLGKVLVGVLATRDGDVAEAEPGRYDRDGTVTTNIQVIGLDLITKRVPMVEDLHYGELVPADQESEQSKQYRRA